VSVKIDSVLLACVEDIARAAGAAIMEVYGRADFDVKLKADDSPLTAADAAAHALIAQRLQVLTPKLPLLSEEDVAGFPGPDAHGCYWLVDPLDGTKEFIKRNGEFTVNIALIEQGVPALGVVYAPVPDVLYAAARSVGAFKQTASGRCAIRVAAHRAGEPWKVVGSRSHAGDRMAEVLERLGPHELLSMGSSLKFCLVAEGSADVYPRLGPTSLWDTAAAQCVVEQAGGKVVGMSGESLGYGEVATLLNPWFVVHGLSAMDWAAVFKGISSGENGLI
jgi:3'(2'), 5'-bisphosphate nucleotidase